MELLNTSHDKLTAPQTPAVECSHQSLMIQLGPISSEKRRYLAARAMQKVRRCWSQRAHIIISAPLGDRGDLEHSIQHCDFVASEVLGTMIRNHRASGRLYVPMANESCDELALFALASGVPLQAISLIQESISAPPASSVSVRPGDAYLLVEGDFSTPGHGIGWN